MKNPLRLLFFVLSYKKVLLFVCLFFVFLNVTYIFLNSVGLKIIAEHFNALNNLKLFDVDIRNFNCSYTV